MRKNLYIVISTLVPWLSSAQIVNEGGFYVEPNTIVSCVSSFSNLEKGEIYNDGLVYYYGNLSNKGIYDFSANLKTSYAFFDRTDIDDQIQNIEGISPLFFNHVVFNNTKKETAFLASGDLFILGNASFKEGIVKIKDKNTQFVFDYTASSTDESDFSHVEGRVIKFGNTRFRYPIGDEGFFRPAFINGTKTIKETVSAEYVLKDQSFFDEHQEAEGVISKINTNEYWYVKDESKLSNSFLLSLTWDERTTLKEVINDPEKELHIVRWDDEKKLWVDEGGVVDMSTKMVTTPTTVKGYGYFTLATVKKDWMLDGDIVIYNLVTPNGDGKNDYFVIENINKYPNNKVEIYNRWGVKVYETINYDSNGDGSINVFTGYSEGRTTVEKNKKLPSGTYFYVLTYEYKDSNGSRMIKKASNLHLETN
ncbi:gliding motility-associated C-terminal domain-containing protein [Myroides odoratimimus]|uniref:gliding motility-associated C-terminal domain-containing protein n=1 Tax=Myroides odoratimimus TaxID=76832 RepID=UPI003100AEC6